MDIELASTLEADQTSRCVTRRQGLYYVPERWHLAETAGLDHQVDVAPRQKEMPDDLEQLSG